MLPEELLREIASHVTFETEYTSKDLFETGYDCRVALGLLRLASRALYRAATPFFFQHITLTSFLPEEGLSNVGWPVHRLRDLCSSGNVVHVRRVDINVHSFDGDQIPTQSYELNAFLPELISQIPNLYSLRVESLVTPLEVIYTPETTAPFVEALADALGRAAIPSLRELEISLPFEQEFRTLLGIGKDRGAESLLATCSGLSHLSLTAQSRYSENLSTTGSSDSDNSDDSDDTASDDTMSDGAIFEYDVSRIVDASENIQSLYIWSSFSLDVEYFRFSPRIVRIYLRSAVLSAKALATLLGNPAISSVTLRFVCLVEGTWKDALLELAKSHLDQLMEFNFESCSYMPGNPDSPPRDQDISKEDILSWVGTTHVSDRWVVRPLQIRAFRCNPNPGYKIHGLYSIDQRHTERHYKTLSGIS